MYIAPADYHLLFDGDSFALSTDEPVRYSRPSIDVSFESAADTYAERTVGVVLTGANADGSRGLKRIADRGGLALVQSPATAESPTMPLAAIALRARRACADDSRDRLDARVAPGASNDERTRDEPGTRRQRRRHPPRRRSPGESARARGDPRAARTAPRARIVGRGRAALSARARLRAHSPRRADARA